MRDKKLEILVTLAALLFLAHAVDHVIRDLHWPLTAEAIPFLLVTAAILALIFGGLSLYRRGTLGAGVWAIFGAVSVTVGWLGHFSPFSEQPPQFIYNAYQSPLARWLALGTLFALMLTLIAVTIYAGMLWARGARRG
jgi:hypothetical protein